MALLPGVGLWGDSSKTLFLMPLDAAAQSLRYTEIAEICF